MGKAVRARWLRLLGKDPGPTLNPDQLLMFTVHLEVMLRCGLPLVEALDVLGHGEDEDTAVVCASLARELSGGRSLSQAMARLPQAFPATFWRSVETGEATGRLDLVLQLLSRSLEAQRRATKSFAGSLVYPSVLLCSCGLMVMVMLYFVFPMIIKVTQDAGVDPPGLTRWLMVVAQPRTFMLTILGLTCTVLAGLALWHSPRTGPMLKHLVERNSPPGRFFFSVQLLLGVRQLSLMLEVGMDMLKALQYTAMVGERSFVLKLALDRVARDVRAGEMVSDSMERQGVFPGALVSMLAVGENVGDLHVMLDSYANMLEDRLTTQLHTFLVALEPVLMGVMGVVVGTILIAAFLPIYNLLSL